MDFIKGIYLNIINAQCLHSFKQLFAHDVRHSVQKLFRNLHSATTKLYKLAVLGNNSCLLWDPLKKTHKYSVGRTSNF
jgi:hypothetical protein